MKIQINTDNNIRGNEVLIDKFSGIITSGLSRFADHLTSVQVHFSDEDGNKNSKNDKRCMLEARLEGHQPVVVIENAESLNFALEGAIDKMESMIESLIGRQHDKRNQRDNKFAISLESTKRS